MCVCYTGVLFVHTAFPGSAFFPALACFSDLIVADHLILHITSLSWAAPLLPNQLLLLVVVVAEVLEGTEGGGRKTILTQHCHHQNDSVLTVV